MGALAYDDAETANTPHRNLVLRALDALATAQMSHSLDVIRRAQCARASIRSVTQPSSSSDCSSTSPCER
jgi:hypothetical protein